jgi:hypothetical protein
MDQITIAGQVFNVPLRYKEGDEINANEAGALNQTYHENLRNNFAKKVEEGLKNGQTVETLQEQLDAYANEYQFGVRTGGGAVRDPVMSEAMAIAKTKIKEHVKKKGKMLRNITAAAMTEAAKKLIERSPEIMQLARERVAATQAAAAEDLEALTAGL